MFFVCILHCLKQAVVSRSILYMQLVSEIKDLILRIFSDHISYVNLVPSASFRYKRKAKADEVAHMS